FRINNLKINSPLSEIDFYEINDIYVKKNGGDNSDYTIKERLKQLKENDGWIHLAGGMSLGITDSQIKKMRLSKKYIKSVSDISKEKVITDLGQPELELTDDLNWLSEYYVDAYILVYKNLNLNIFLNPETLKIKEIIIGELDKTNYTLIK
ncbi:MAG TPA: hypothetical protein PKI86_06195, partial [Chitinophagales bacterium]|nr:hypothetical protein [Chitinophagales bacterium]